MRLLYTESKSQSPSFVARSDLDGYWKRILGTMSSRVVGQMVRYFEEFKNCD